MKRTIKRELSPWLAQLLTLTSPTICRVGPPAGHSGELWCSSSRRVTRLETQDEPMFHFECSGREKRVSQWKGRQAGGGLSPSVSLLILLRTSAGQMRPIHVREQSALLSLPLQMPLSSKNTLTQTPRITFARMPRHPVAQSNGCPRW